MNCYEFFYFRRPGPYILLPSVSFKHIFPTRWLEIRSKYFQSFKVHGLPWTTSAMEGRVVRSAGPVPGTLVTEYPSPAPDPSPYTTRSPLCTSVVYGSLLFFLRGLASRLRSQPRGRVDVWPPKIQFMRASDTDARHRRRGDEFLLGLSKTLHFAGGARRVAQRRGAIFPIPFSPSHALPMMFGFSWKIKMNSIFEWKIKMTPLRD